MNSSTVFLVCLQALLFAQNAYSQGLNSLGNPGIGLGYSGLNGLGAVGGYTNGLINGPGYLGSGIAPGINGFGIGAGLPLGYGTGLPLGYGAGVPNVAATASVPVTGPFVATGTAELAVGGDFGIGGQTVVGGQVPVIGAVSFGGQIPAGGVVSIAGNCGCASIPL